MKTLEPIPKEAWNEIKEEAVTVLNSALSARKVINLEGPKGMDHPAVPLGRLNITEGTRKDQVRHGIHKMLPMIELKSPFTLDIHEVETIARGARDADLDPVMEAAAKLATAEDKIIYKGYKKAEIPGITTTSENTSIKWPEDPEDIPKTVSEAILSLQYKNIDGPYHLVLDCEKWKEINMMVGGYVLKKQLDEIIDGDIVLNKNTNDNLMLSGRGDDFTMTLGKDVSLGYEYQEQELLRLYLLESFTFLVTEPRASVIFN